MSVRVYCVNTRSARGVVRTRKCFRRMRGAEALLRKLDGQGNKGEWSGIIMKRVPTAKAPR